MPEFSRLVESKLGHKLEPAQRRALAYLDETIERELSDLAALLMSGELSPEIYPDRVASLMREALSSARVIIGLSNFNEIFDEASQNPEGLFDKEKFYEHTVPLIRLR